ncbi:HugZ family pyridoxamine 5'-phosphate oxidase [Alteromonas gilva]|uniref:DUF2470 domain-containing protein n=1 Tax=Alteromonas gilva TaxID=2987522 RepID=A0ABT5KZD9_9ALTE|nr:DUF2470 domain-containing protein [Alteromonas gilva]MDC8830008.1 DUF2470 domain-containing protein [Alteromonas gilva]
MSMKQLSQEAKQLCRAQHSGVLSTQSTSMPGYPFGSIVPFVITHTGDVIIYISDIALHTRNIKANDKVSLTVFDPSEEDSQSNGRVTIMGDAQLADSPDNAELYFRLFPQAEAYQHTHDFHFYRINVARVRYIGGFGKIHWINPEYWQTEEASWHSQINAMISHMNEDHQDAMQLILRHYANVSSDKVTMISVFSDGAHYCTERRKIVFVPFAGHCDDATAIRKALVSQTNTSREALATAD